jgi:hypothetical protein
MLVRERTDEPGLDFNEPEIGEVFKTTTIPREELFVTTKLYVSIPTLSCLPPSAIYPQASHLAQANRRILLQDGPPTTNAPPLRSTNPSPTCTSTM